LSLLSEGSIMQTPCRTVQVFKAFETGSRQQHYSRKKKVPVRTVKSSPFQDSTFWNAVRSRRGRDHSAPASPRAVSCRRQCELPV